MPVDSDSCAPLCEFLLNRFIGATLSRMYLHTRNGDFMS
jgi:hypothetical protein